MIHLTPAQAVELLRVRMLRPSDNATYQLIADKAIELSGLYTDKGYAELKDLVALYKAACKRVVVTGIGNIEESEIRRWLYNAEWIVNSGSGSMVAKVDVGEGHLHDWVELRIDISVEPDRDNAEELG